MLIKKSVKTLTLITIASLLINAAYAQLKLPVINNGLATDVKKVIEDFPNRFINLMGEMLQENPQSTDYHCNFKVSGAEECFITRYAAKKTICSWEALMLTTENFEKARQKFRSIYTQLNNLSVVMPGENTLRLKGNYEMPVEERKFTSILFSPEQASGAAAKLKIEISMQFFAPMEWKVKLMIYDREREDDERGKIIE